MNDTTFPKTGDNLYIQAISGETEKQMYLVLDPSVPSWVIINKDGVELLELCNGKRSPDTIAQRISQRSNIDFSDALQSVHSFLRQMEDKLLINNSLHQNRRDNQFHGLALEITKECNLRCRHCYLAAGKQAIDELNTDEIKKLIAAIGDAGGGSLAIGGGEPLLRSDCLDILDYALSCNLLVSMGTNATLIDKKLAATLANLPIKIQISLDGATEQVHDAIRGKGSFRAAVQGIDALVEKNKAKDLVIAFTPMQSNRREVLAIIEFARRRKIPVLQYPPLTRSGRAKERWDKLQLSSDQMLEFWETVNKRSAELQGEMDLLADCFSINIHQAGSPFQCSIGTQFRVDPTGDVYPCQCFHSGADFQLGNVKTQSLKSMIEGEKIKAIKALSIRRPATIDSCSVCRWQKYCGAGCMGNAFETTGTVLYPSSCETRKKWIESLFTKAVEETKQTFLSCS
ncbi:MAG: PqqD family peptide modification chaperone [Proteobacteria bacterium]|nr:PqqD family peptide modification chaperone [Pseudomonadota bacterium]MBU1057705.1 PqqD family peptide modification chaperone [Pseudomonadota bacterium]